MAIAWPTVPQTSNQQAAWVVGCRAIGIATTLASNIIAARLLGPSEFGVFIVVTTLIALGSLLGMAGLNEAGLRFVAESLATGRESLARTYVRRACWIAATASLVAALGTAAAATFLQWRIGHFERPTLVVLLISMGVIALAWQQLAAELLRGYGALRLASMFSGGQLGGPISNIVCLFGLSACALILTSVDASLALGLTVVSILVTVPFALAALWQISGVVPLGDLKLGSGLSTEQKRELLGVGGVLLSSQLLVFGSQQLDIWLGGVLLAPESLGLYGAAKRSLLVVAMPMQMATLTTLSAIPRLHAQGRMEEFARVVRNTANLAAIPALAALVLLVLLPGPMLGIIFGNAYSGAAPTMLVLAAGHLALIVFGNPPHLLSLTGRHRQVLVVNLASLLVLLIVGGAGARLYGAPGLAAGSAASLALQNCVLWWLTRRELGVWSHVNLRPDYGSPQCNVDASQVLADPYEGLASAKNSTPPAPQATACPG